MHNKDTMLHYFLCQFINMSIFKANWIMDLVRAWMNASEARRLLFKWTIVIFWNLIISKLFVPVLVFTCEIKADYNWVRATHPFFKKHKNQTLKNYFTTHTPVLKTFLDHSKMRLSSRHKNIFDQDFFLLFVWPSMDRPRSHGQTTAPGPETAHRPPQSGQ